MNTFRFAASSYGILVISLAVASHDAVAGVSYTVAGSTYSQNFDTLPITPANASLGNSPAGWTDDNAAPGAGNFSIVGWYLWHPITATEGGFNSHQRMRTGPGSSTTGAFMSWGANTSTTERALGSLDSNTMADPAGTNPADNMSIGLRISNDTGLTLTDFTLTYDGEQWRNGGSGVANVLSFAYSLTATTANWTNAAGGPDFTAVSTLNFTAPVVSITAAAVDGNVAGKVSGISATVSGLNWASGTDLWLRWQDPNDSGADDGLGIDNVSFSAVQTPEPSALSLLVLGGAGLLLRRLKK